MLITECKFYFICDYICPCKSFAPKNKCFLFPFYGVNWSNFEDVPKLFFGIKKKVWLAWYHAMAGIILGEKEISISATGIFEAFMFSAYFNINKAHLNKYNIPKSLLLNP